MNLHYPLWLAILILGSALAADPPSAPNTQRPGDEPILPADALRSVRVPEGFQVTLFAAEPDVRQPVAMTFDDRGRLWVVECYSYPEWKAPDRVLILEDRDHDGRFDTRTVFMEGGHNLTGIEVGFGGVWLCSAPNLIFVADRNGDDTPDGPPDVLLDGWDTKDAHHNIFNGLAWGPDGWLYGCQGILAQSAIGAPGTPADQRVRMNCGVWRFHPQLKVFEVVAHGTTNPWGLDWNDVGEAFFTNCVIGHLWHLVPGAHYQRMFGNDFEPYLYGLIGATSDHLHWGGGHWTDSRGGDGRHDVAGGGHAHCGAMVYLGDNWPPSYRDTFFTVNIHGRRLNNDLLEPRGSGYVGRHGKDFGSWSDPWFRGVVVKYGPDGAVYVSDWSDVGECHDADGVHRTSGRIYKISYGTPDAPRIANLATLSLSELVELQTDRNEWYVRHARRRLQEMTFTPQERVSLYAALGKLFKASATGPQRLRCAWALNATGGLASGVNDLLRDADEHVRTWGVRLLVDAGRNAAGGGSRSPAIATLATLAAQDSSPVVRLAVAGALQRVPPKERGAVLKPLLAHGEDAEDHNLPLMIWYATEPTVLPDLPGALELASNARMPQVSRFIFRRAAEDAGGMQALLALLSRAAGDELRLTILREIGEAMSGRADVVMPAGWPAVLPGLLGSGSAAVVREAESLSVTFGDREILPRMREILASSRASIEDRLRAMELLIRARDSELTRLLPSMMNKLPDLREPALRAMARFNDAQTPAVILSAYERLTAPERQAAIGTLASRPPWANALLDAMEKGVVQRRDVSAFHVRQMLGLKDATIRTRLEKAWGAIRGTSQDKAKQLAHYHDVLSPRYLESADLSNGRAIFVRTCMTCHTLFGLGSSIGPDLTGSDRANVDYILENVLDPSAIVGKEYQLSLFELDEGQMLAGIVRGESDSAVTLQTPTEQVVLPKSLIRERRTAELSMMPEELLAGLKNEEIRDLIAYLASPVQVPLPGERK